MKRSLVRAFVIAAVVAGTAADAPAGWRSADRREIEDDYEEPPEYEVYLGDDRPGYRGDDPRDRLHRDFRDEPLRDAPAGTGTQPYWGSTRPYWGTMRPYWNAGEPPGVIHRQPRTEPLRVR